MKSSVDDTPGPFRAKLFPLLQKVPAFSPLPFSTLQELADRFVPERIAPQTILIHEGERSDKLFIILEGRVEISILKEGKPIFIAASSSGDLIGELAIFMPGSRRTATVTAATPLEAASIPIDVFLKILSRNTEAQNIFSQNAHLVLLYNFLKLATLFQTLKPEQLRKLASLLKRIVSSPGEIIFRQGEVGDRCYLVQEGEIEILQKEGSHQKGVASLGPGTLFGETSLLTEAPRNATARATKHTGLLALERNDFLNIVSKNTQVSCALFDLLRLRDKPLRHSNVLTQSYISQEGESITILKDPTRGNYYRLSSLGWFVWERLDGHHNVKDLSLEYLKKAGTFSPHAIAHIVAGLMAEGFVESRVSRAQKHFPSPPFVARLCTKLKDLLTWRKNIRGIDPFLARVYRLFRLRFLFTKTGQGVMGTISLAGLILFIANGSDILSLPTYFSGWGSSIFYAALFMLVLVAVHDAGHAFATKFFGREVLSVGIGWYWINPILYVDTSDTWPLPPQKRIVVHLAGLYANVFFAGLSTLVGWLFPVLYGKALLFSSLSYYVVLLNLIPVMQLDGHYALQTFLEMRRPRQHTDQGAARLDKS